MKRMFAKWWLWVSLTLILCLLIMMCAKMDEAAPLSFLLESPSQSRALNIYDGEDGNYYVFLPSYARLEDLKIELTGDEAVFLGDTKLTDGMDCGGFSPETGYLLRVNDRRMATVWFYRSENVATMYIDTASGSMARIHEDKNYKESAHVEIYTDSGALSLSDSNVTLKGRGNSTWLNDKKPYLLSLSTPADVLGMGAAEKWVLLANALDETNLRNKMVLDIAHQLIPYWTPQCVYVDLYLNGQYNGLYLLAEKIEVSPNRLNLDLSAGEFLCKIDLPSRINTLNAPFSTETGRTVEITFPERPTRAESEEVASRVAELEQMILSQQDLCTFPGFDMHSWVSRYLLDEISANIDSDKASSYFYLSGGTFFAGPLWDYDLTFGLHRPGDTPAAFLAKQKHKESLASSSYYDALYANPSFQAALKETYQAELLPILDHLLSSGIDAISEEISAASCNNTLRWKTMFQTQHQSMNGFNTTASLKAYLSERVSFLNDAWIEQTEFVTVQFEHTKDKFYENISVETGSILELEHIDIVDTVWLDSGTGEIFDFSRPITEDVILVKQEGNSPETEWVLRDYITFASLAALGSLLLCFAGVDLLHRRKERRKIHGRTHVSP